MKFSLYSKKNRLDEMQEQTMRKIESHGFWLLWGSLLAAWIVQTVFGAADKAAGEWVVFMIGCIYMVVACLRNGLWDRHLSDKAPANAKMCAALVSLFRIHLWSDIAPKIHADGLNRAIDDWCQSQGIDIDYREGVRQKFYRMRRSYETYGIILGKKHCHKVGKK